MTEGKNLADAMEMARDAIGLYGISREDHGESIPEGSTVEDIDVTKGTFAEDGKGILSYVDVDFGVYSRH